MGVGSWIAWRPDAPYTPPARCRLAFVVVESLIFFCWPLIFFFLPFFLIFLIPFFFTIECSNSTGRRDRRSNGRGWRLWTSHKNSRRQVSHIIYLFFIFLLLFSVYWIFPPSFFLSQFFPILSLSHCVSLLDSCLSMNPHAH